MTNLSTSNQPHIDKSLQVSATQVLATHHSKYEASYSGAGFWKKLLNQSKNAGKEVVSNALTLYYTAKAKETPVWCKTVILGTLGYFISVIDGIPDMTPILGYSDDMALMIAAITTLASHITPEIKAQAQARTTQLFGPKED
ncbi:MAG: DUF1232 domain-containing protein [Hahellaceae bacterium]|nr:DUF1232 domain-containing protein [Hahellaceae bacterium]MCP5169061.1 DUF1232 domain-containing protein [Hahellaceae bacterium]